MKTDKIRGLAAPVFLVLCIILGGASAPRDAILPNAILQITALGLILFSLWTRKSAPYSDGSNSLLLIGGAWLLVGLIYFVPLPYGLWSALPGRDAIAHGFEMVGIAETALPVSTTVELSIISLLGLLPPTALFLLTLQLTHSQRRRLVLVFIGVAALAASLGAAQVALGPQSQLRFYQITNPGMAVGFFANGNHQATLLLCALLFVGFVMARATQKRGSSRSGNAALAAPSLLALFFLVAVGVVGSLAGYALLILAGAGIFLLCRRAAGKIGWKWLAGVGATLAVALGSGVALTSSVTDQAVAEQLGEGRTSRAVMAAVTAKAAATYFPVGTGLGSFVDIYRTFEDPQVPAGEYVNHAHNDYLELALETGLPGILVVLAFLLWFGLRAIKAWRNSGDGGNLARAASLTVGLVLIHSLIDYPIRTAAIGAVFAMSCAFLVPARLKPRSRLKSVDEAPDLRHIEAV